MTSSPASPVNPDSHFTACHLGAGYSLECGSDAPATTAFQPFAAIILLTALYVVLNLIFPGLFDSLLYDPDQLEILDYVSE